MEIRTYQNEDYAAVRDILEKGGVFWEKSDSEEYLRRKSEENPDSMLVATEDGRVVGTVFAVFDFMPFLFRLAVHPDYRRRGVGTELMQRAEEAIQGKGYNRANILIAADDTELQEMYERMGYEKGHLYRWMVKEFDSEK